jgi:NAD(P)-dependent dehydrogenase (short-subunit alcohol dehydrogenase family)
MTTIEVSNKWSQILLDKVVFITGAGGGIGSAISQTCALHGARVVVSDINKSAADKVVANIVENDNEKSDKIMSLELDTVDEQAIEQAVKQVVDKWGTIHVLVNAYVYKLESNQVINCILYLFPVLLVSLWV